MTRVQACASNINLQVQQVMHWVFTDRKAVTVYMLVLALSAGIESITIS